MKKKNSKKSKTTKPLPPLKPFLIGRYQLGWRMVNLYAQPHEKGAYFNLCYRGKDAYIHVGMDHRDCAEAFGCLCHEVWEMIMDELTCCFRPKAFQENASDVFHFFFNHNQHTEISARASYFIFNAFNDFKKAHLLCEKHRKKVKSST